jgi:hypothetical protein
MTIVGTILGIRRSWLTAGLFVITDALLLAAGAILSFLIRLDTIYIQELYVSVVAVFVVLVLVVRLPLLYLFGLYRPNWRYAGPRELLLSVSSMSFGSLIIGVVVFVFLLPQHVVHSFPRTVVFIEWMMSIFVVGGLRFSLRLLEEGWSWRQRQAAVELVRQSGYEDEVDYLAAVRSLNQRMAAGDYRPYGAAYDPATDAQATYGDESWLDALASYATLAQSFYHIGQYETALKACQLLLDTILLVRTSKGLAFSPPGRSLQIDLPAMQRGYYLSLRRMYGANEFYDRAVAAWQRYRPLQEGEDALEQAFARDKRTLRGLAQAVQRAQSRVPAAPSLTDLLALVSRGMKAIDDQKGTA